MVIKVAINGYGTIGKRVADAVDAQDDMEIVGVTKTRPAFGCDLAVRKGYPIFCTYDAEEKIQAFVSIKEFNEEKSIVMCTKKGLIKRTNLMLYSKPRKGGIYAIDINEGDELIQAKTISKDQDIILA